jgi:hypothetical protein
LVVTSSHSTQFVGWYDPCDGNEGLEEEGHPVVDCVEDSNILFQLILDKVEVPEFEGKGFGVGGLETDFDEEGWGWEGVCGEGGFCNFEDLRIIFDAEIEPV